MRYFNDLIVTHEDEEYMHKCVPLLRLCPALAYLPAAAPLPMLPLIAALLDGCSPALHAAHCLLTASPCVWLSCRHYSLKLEDGDMYFIRTDPANR